MTGPPQNVQDPLWVGTGGNAAFNTYQSVYDPIDADDIAYAQGIAMRTNGLEVSVPKALTEGGSDGAASLGIIPVRLRANS